MSPRWGVGSTLPLAQLGDSHILTVWTEPEVLRARPAHQLLA